MANHLDTLVPPYIPRSDTGLHHSRDCAPVRNVALLQPTLALCFALGVSCACGRKAPLGDAPTSASEGSVGAGGSLLVSPQGETHIGPQDDFDPARLHITYLLSNETEEPLRWQGRVSEPWLELSGPESGLLAPREYVEVPVDVDPNGASQGDVDPAVAEVVFLEDGAAPVLATRTVTIELKSGFGGDGWTKLTPSVDTRTVYVSSGSGSDLDDGLSPSTPKRTLAAAKALLRHGFPDRLLLKRGDVWNESLGQWKKSGRSANEPMVVSTYGNETARPLLRTGLAGGIWSNGGGGSPATIDNLAFVGLHFFADGYSGDGVCVGVQLLQPGSHVLIEDCKIEGYRDNVVFQGYSGRHTDYRLRRSVILDAYSIHAIGGHSQGLYAYAVDGLLIEENVFDHNGWNENVPGAGADIYSHNLYIDNDNTSVVVRGNIISNASSHGMQLRPGGSVINNLFLRNSIALSVGGGNSPDPDGVTADVRGNVILDGKDIDAANPRGWGMWFGNIASGRVVHNVIANNTLGTQPSVMILDGSPGIGIHDLVIENNILFNWGGSLLVNGDSLQITNIDLIDNDVQNTTWQTPLLEHTLASSAAIIDSSSNHLFCQLLPASAWTTIELVPRPLSFWFSLVGDTTSAVEEVAYADAARSAASYNASLGGVPTLGAFLAEVRLQAFGNWRLAYTAVRANRYIRAGF